jgi:hypothetical protein
MFQVRRMSSVAAVAAEDAIDHGTDKGNAIAGASAVAVARVVASAAVVDRAATTIVAAAAVVAATAGSNDTTTTSVASRSTSSAGVTSRSISATGRANHRVSAAMSGKGLSAATMTAARMAGSQRIRRHWHATQRDRGRESDESFFVNHVILLLWLWFKQKSVCDYKDNAGSPLKVARHKDTFACQIATRFALIARVWFGCPCLAKLPYLVSNSAQTQRGHRTIFMIRI